MKSANSAGVLPTGVAPGRAGVPPPPALHRLGAVFGELAFTSAGSPAGARKPHHTPVS